MIKQISVFVENKMGRMAEITKTIGEAGVDIRALSVADTSDFGILRLIVDRPEEAVESLRKAGITVTLTDVVAVGVDDIPGGLASAIEAIANAEINIEYMYAFISRTGGKAYVILRVDNIESAATALEQRGIQLLSGEEIYNM